jgi:enoyl reductase-like protein
LSCLAILQIFNRGMECWRDFDTKYFKIDRKLREAAILKDKQEIIARINSDFQKLYFPKKADGTVCELEDMTYAEVARCGKNSPFLKCDFIEPKTERICQDRLGTSMGKS